jgi:secondary thiamine-phosphate synthase enzyme
VTRHTNLIVSTRGKGLYPFTDAVEKWLREQRVSSGLVTLFAQHTSCSLIIQENADPDVTLDLSDFFERLAPESGEHYRHRAEGPDDMTSHIRAALTQTSVSIPVIEGRMTLGTWQGLYVFEHRAQAHRRHVVAHFLGDGE